MKTVLKVVVGLALSALTLFLFFRNLDLAMLRHGLAGANWGLLLVAVMLGYFGHLAARSMRWAAMLAPLGKRVSFYNLFSTTAIGYLVSWLAPGRVGEVVRPVLLARREALPVAATVATVAVERVLDAASIVTLAAAAALSAPLWWRTPGGSVSVTLPLVGAVDLVRAAPWLGAAGLIGCVLAYAAARFQLREGSALQRRLERGETGSAGVRRTLWGIARSLVAGAYFLRDGRRAGRVALYSFLVWTIIGLSTWIGLVAAGVRIPFLGVFLLLVAATVGISVPTPGGFGPVQFLFQQTLIGLFGVEPNRASVATVIYHPILVYIPPVLFGIAFAWRDGLTPGRLRALAETDPAAKDLPAADQELARSTTTGRSQPRQ